MKINYMILVSRLFGTKLGGNQNITLVKIEKIISLDKRGYDISSVQEPILRSRQKEQSLPSILLNQNKHKRTVLAILPVVFLLEV